MVLLRNSLVSTTEALLAVRGGRRLIVGHSPSLIPFSGFDFLFRLTKKVYDFIIFPLHANIPAGGADDLRCSGEIFSHPARKIPEIAVPDSFKMPAHEFFHFPG